MCTPSPHWSAVSRAFCSTRDGGANGGLCSLLPGPLTLICCNRASTLNTKHIDVLENPGGSLPFLVRGAWHAGRERRWGLARVPSGASGRSQLSICQELCPPRGQRVGRGGRGAITMPQRERERVDREGALRFRAIEDTAVVCKLMTRNERKAGRVGGRAERGNAGRMPPSSSV